MSGDTNTIWVASAYLDALEHQVRNVMVNLSFANERFFHSPIVDNAYQELSGKWNDGRNDLDTRLTAIADALADIRRTFDALDADGASQLESGSGGQRP